MEDGGTFRAELLMRQGDLMIVLFCKSVLNRLPTILDCKGTIELSTTWMAEISSLYLFDVPIIVLGFSIWQTRGEKELSIPAATGWDI